MRNGFSQTAMQLQAPDPLCAFRKRLRPSSNAMPELVPGCVTSLSLWTSYKETDLIQSVCQCVDGCRQWLSLGVELSCLVGRSNAVCEVWQRLQHVAQQLGIAQRHSHATTCQGVPAFTPHLFFIMLSIGLFSVLAPVCSNRHAFHHALLCYCINHASHCYPDCRHGGDEVDTEVKECTIRVMSVQLEDCRLFSLQQCT